MSSASIVEVSTHALLAGYVGRALGDGARTPARRELSRACYAFAIHSAAVAAGHLARPGPSELWFDGGLIVAWLSLVFLIRFARSLDGRVGFSRPMRWSFVVGGLAIAAPFADAVRRGLHGEVDTTDSAVQGGVVLATYVVLLAMLLRTVFAKSEPSGRARAARSYLLACAWPVVPLVFNIALNSGLDLPAPGFVRDACMLLFLYGLLAAYLDHADEPIPLHVRFVASTLTIVLIVVAAACEAFVRTDSSDPALARVEALHAVRLAAMGVVAVLAVFLAGPRLYRRSVVAPLDNLVGGMRRMESGERDVRLAVAYDDEIGYVTRAFNSLVSSLGSTERELADRLAEVQAKNAEVRALNDELRQQVAARSRELAEALARANPEGTVFAEGDIIDGRYRIDAVLGSGGMGIVYRSTRLHDARAVAIKMMQQTTQDGLARFAREARIAAGIDHRNVVSIFDVGVFRGAAYLVMELVDGGSLEDLRGFFGDVAWALPTLRDIARGLAFLHAKGIVHRDMKPANVLSSPGSAKITDFGIAQQDFGPEVNPVGPTMARLTATGALVGTLPYMAPELIDGSRHATTASDVFALGLIAFEMLSGQPAFDVPPVLVSRTGLPPARELPAELDAEIRSAVKACLDVAPRARPPASALADLLDGAAGPVAR